MIKKISFLLFVSLLFFGESLVAMKPVIDSQKKNTEVALGIEASWVSLPAAQEDDDRQSIALTEKLNAMAVVDEPCGGYLLEREKSCRDLCQENMTAVYGVYLISKEDLSKELFDNCTCPMLMQRWVEDKTFWPELRKAFVMKFIAELKKSVQH